ncbi:AAA family ATPase [Haloarculaceae archaeon H-GB11]|nr:AAA family ATPase [Haloarculaceae archaeon H-GB11]
MIKRIEISNFRSLLGKSSDDGADTSLEVDDAITILIGPNEAGKTNILSGIRLLGNESPILPEDLSNYGEGYEGRSHSEIDILRLELDHENSNISEPVDRNRIPWLHGPFTPGDLLNIREQIPIEEFQSDNYIVATIAADGTPEIIRRASGSHEIDFVEPENGWTQEQEPLVSEYPMPLDEFLTVRQNALDCLMRWFVKNVYQIQELTDPILGENPAEREEELTIEQRVEEIAEEFGSSDIGARANPGSELDGDEEGTRDISPIEIAEEASRLLTAQTRLSTSDNPIDDLPLIINQMNINRAQTEYDILKHQDSPVVSGLFKLGSIRLDSYDSYGSSELKDDLDFACEELSRFMNSFWEFDHKRSDRRDEIEEPSESRYQFTYELDSTRLSLFLKDGETTKSELGRRSDGMRWIVTFLLSVLGRTIARERRSIVLLDDPGIHLHPEAEKKLLRAFDYIVPAAQVVFSTHSPALIDQREPDRLRIIKHSSNSEQQGTTVTNDIVEDRVDDGQVDALSTARQALGWHLSDSLFSGEPTVLVEGTTDKRYFELFNQFFLIDEDREYLEQDTAFLDSGGEKITFLSKILQHEEATHVLLRDDDKLGEECSPDIEDRTLYYRDVDIDGLDVDYSLEVEDLIQIDVMSETLEEMYPDDLNIERFRGQIEAPDRPILDLANDCLPDEKSVDKGELSKHIRNKIREGLRENTGEYERTADRFETVIAELKQLLG